MPYSHYEPSGLAGWRRASFPRRHVGKPSPSANRRGGGRTFGMFHAVALQVSALHSAQRALVADGSFDSDALGALVDLVQGALRTHL